MSGLAATNCLILAVSTRLAARRCGTRAAVPVRRFDADTFHAQPALTPNRSANSRNVPLPAA